MEPIGLLFMATAAFTAAIRGAHDKRVKERVDATKHFKPPNIHGEGTGFATDKDCKRAGLFDDDGISLGYSAESGRELTDHSDANLVMIAPSGAGKTTSYLLPNILGLDDRSQFIIDIKEELIHVAARHRASLGPMYVVAPYARPGDFPRGVKIVRINPMSPLFDGSFRPSMRESIARRNSDNCISGSIDAHNAFFTGGARNIFTDVQLAVARYGKVKTLPVVAQIIAGDFESYSEQMVMRNDSELSPRFAGYLDQMRKQSRGFADLLATAAVETAWMLDAAMAGTLSGSDCKLEELGERVCTFAVVAPMTFMDVNGKLSRLIVGSAFWSLLRLERPRKREIVMYCDEAFQYGTMDALLSSYATSRAFSVRIFSVWQDLAQIKERYPRGYSSILANSLQIFMGAREPETAMHMQQMSGYREVISHSQNVTYGDGLPNIAQSQSQMRREVLMAHEAMNLPSDEALLWVRGVPGVIRAKHVPYWKAKGWKYSGRYDKNPLYR